MRRTYFRIWHLPVKRTDIAQLPVGHAQTILLNRARDWRHFRSWSTANVTWAVPIYYFREYHVICHQSNTTDVTSGAGPTYPSGAPKFTLKFLWSSCCSIIILLCKISKFIILPKFSYESRQPIFQSTGLLILKVRTRLKVCQILIRISKLQCFSRLNS